MKVPDQSDVKITRTACMATNCGTSCGIMVHVKNGVMTKVEPADYPEPEWRYACRRGLCNHKVVHHRDRLKYPLKRVGERGEGKWQRISWDEALDNIANKLNELKEKYGGNGKVIVTACQLTRWKGVDGIISALPEIKRHFNQVTLLVLGEGQEKEKLIQLAKDLGAQDEVKFLGKINHKEIINYFKIADVFILNSNYEGLSHTLLEAISAGCPIITTTSGGNPEVIENDRDGILIDYNNKEELA